MSTARREQYGGHGQVCGCHLQAQANAVFRRSDAVEWIIRIQVELRQDQFKLPTSECAGPQQTRRNADESGTICCCGTLSGDRSQPGEYAVKSDRSIQSDGRQSKRPARGLPPGKSRRQAPLSGIARNPNDSEQKVCGFHACLGIFERRPDDIIRVYLTEERSRHVSVLLKWCAAHRRAYNIVESDNLERLSGSSHHEGIMVLARKSTALDDASLLKKVRDQSLRGPFLYLDGLQNPHNLGALLRTAAHFGVSALLGADGDLPEVSAATARVAEGGAEHVAVVGLRDPLGTLAELRDSGFVVLATSSHQGKSLYQERLSPRTIFVLGGEQSGISGELLQAADRCLQIPGTSQVESLNVSVAGAVLLSEWYRQQGIAGAGRPQSSDRRQRPNQRQRKPAAKTGRSRRDTPPSSD